MATISSGRQIRAGRALLGWSQVELAGRAKLHKNAVAYWEKRDTIKARRDIGGIKAMRDALEGEGVRFVAGGAALAA